MECGVNDSVSNCNFKRFAATCHFFVHGSGSFEVDIRSFAGADAPTSAQILLFPLSVYKQLTKQTSTPTSADLLFLSITFNSVLLHCNSNEFDANHGVDVTQRDQDAFRCYVIQWLTKRSSEQAIIFYILYRLKYTNASLRSY